MSHDPTKYPRPDDFLPERFLAANSTLKDSDETDLSFIFGFGRRVCPGRHFANASLWIAIANLLAVFEFRQPKNDKGEEVPIVPEWTYGLTSHLEPFACDIVPRHGRDTNQIERISSLFVEAEA